MLEGWVCDGRIQNADTSEDQSPALPYILASNRALLAFVLCFWLLAARAAKFDHPLPFQHNLDTTLEGPRPLKVVFESAEMF